MEIYDRIGPSDPEVKAVDDAVARVFDSIINNPFLGNPKIKKDIVFTAGVDKIIDHTLNNSNVRYLVVGINAPAVIYKSSTVNVAPSAHIILKSNVDCVATILFF